MFQTDQFVKRLALEVILNQNFQFVELRKYPLFKHFPT